MREVDRPVDERVSVLDRAASEGDLPDEHLLQGFAGEVDTPSIRLALVLDDRRVYVGLGTRPESLFLCAESTDGASACIGPRANLAAGAFVQGAQTNDRYETVGIVADSVTAVRVGDIDAVLDNNVFVADAPYFAQVYVTTAEGERAVLTPAQLRRDF